MTEIKKERESEDLSGFSDYLSEFDGIIKFDAETCPVCGVDVSNSISLDNSPFIKVLTFRDKKSAEIIAEKLFSENIKFKFEERLDGAVRENINYIYDLYIPFRESERFQILIRSMV